MEDGFAQIGRRDPDRVKGRLRIQYVNEAGLPEAGIDGGGLFKDFMEELLRQGFSPQVCAHTPHVWCVCGGGGMLGGEMLDRQGRDEATCCWCLVVVIPAIWPAASHTNIRCAASRTDGRSAPFLPDGHQL